MELIKKFKDMMDPNAKDRLVRTDYFKDAKDLYTENLNTIPQGGSQLPVKRMFEPRHFDFHGYKRAYKASANEPVRRAVIYPTMICNERCKFCYYLDMIDNPGIAPTKEIPLGGARHRDLDRLKTELAIYKHYYDFTHVDVTGGEPTIFPGLFELVQHAADIGLKPCIISNGQIPGCWEKLRDHGLHDVLLSIHGFQEDQDAITQKKGSWDQLLRTFKKLQKMDFSFRTNCVVGIWDYQYLPELAKFIAKEVRPRIHNFIVFNPHEGNQWGRDYEGTRRKFEEQAGYQTVAPNLKKAIDTLVNAGIWPNVRFMPMCLMEGYEQYICNFYQWQFDPHEWFYHQYSHKNLLKRVKLATEAGFYGGGIDAALAYVGKQIETNNNVYAKTCKECSYFKICDGIYPQYEQFFGLNEFKPVNHKDGMIEDPMHFRRNYAGYRIPKEDWKGPSQAVVNPIPKPHGCIWSTTNDDAGEV